MLKKRTLFCDLGVRAIPHVIQKVFIPLEKWKIAPKIPSKYTDFVIMPDWGSAKPFARCS